MRVPTVAVVGVLLWSAVSGAQDGGVKVSPEVAKAIRALRSPKPQERIDAAKLLSRQSSDIVPALMPWSWGCGETTAREGASPSADCGHLNEATYQVVGVLSAIGRREPAKCEPSCPARNALFGLTTAQGGIDWDRLPLEDDDSALPKAVRNEALKAYGTVQFRDSFAIPDWRPPSMAPSATVGTTSIFLVASTTPSSMYAECAAALYVESDRGRVGRLVARNAHDLGLSCELGKVAAAPVAGRPGALAVAVEWVPLGDQYDVAQEVLIVEPVKGQLKLLCSVGELGKTDLLARLPKLIRVGPSGCVDLKGQPVRGDLDAKTLPK
jgi:hypothetical protein